MKFNSPVYPIPPSFDKELLELNSTSNYLTFLEKSGAATVMSTAGTSQFNLLSLDEIRDLNSCISTFSGQRIIGLPAISSYHLLKEIEEFYNNLEDIYLLVLFPERFYNNNQIIDFYKSICSASKHPVLAHGNPIRKGFGGTYEYDRPLLKELSQINNFIGIKEESSSIGFSMNILQSLDLEVIVAGGSMRRFWALEPFGATTFLSGVGSFNPQIEEDFFSFYKNNQLEEAKKIIKQTENPFHNVFMKIGWHASMRYALKFMGYLNGNRDPFVTLSNSEIELIEEALHKVIIKDHSI